MWGLIEGFYGTPWTWEERIELCRVLAAEGMDTYVYAPKDDPLHRAGWRVPYPADQLAGFERLVSSQPMRVGFSVSPGLSMDPDAAADRAALLAKYRQLTERGVSLVGLLFDDLEPRAELGTVHGRTTAWLREQLPDEVELFLVPLHYTGVASSPYLEELVRELPVDVKVGWTGRFVVNDVITAQDARERAAALDGRAPLLWDNTPVNDAVMQRHLFTGPLRGRDPDMTTQLSGYLANPMVQARASRPALVSAAAWCRGADPMTAWRDALGPDRVLMEGCDGEVPGLLAAAALGGDPAALTELTSWFAEAAKCDAGTLGEAVQPWVDQLREEAAVGGLACQVLAAEPDEAAQLAPILLVMWPVASTSHEVLGGRGSLVPSLGQDEQSRWVASPAAFRPGTHLVDRLVEAAFARLA